MRLQSGLLPMGTLGPAGDTFVFNGRGGPHFGKGGWGHWGRESRFPCVSPGPHISRLEWGRCKANEHGAVPKVPIVPNKCSRAMTGFLAKWAEDEPKRGASFAPLKQRPPLSGMRDGLRWMA